MLRIESYLLSVVIIFCSTVSVFAGELDKDCESAVDAADRVGSDITKECDYSNVGLNGVLHRAIANKEQAVDKKHSDEKSAETSSKNVKTTANVADAPPTGIPLPDAAINIATGKKPSLQVVSAEFGTSQQLATARYELIRNASLECAAGFVLDKERYLPIGNKVMRLELTYSCL